MKSNLALAATEALAPKTKDRPKTETLKTFKVETSKSGVFVTPTNQQLKGILLGSTRKHPPYTLKDLLRIAPKLQQYIDSGLVEQCTELKQFIEDNVAGLRAEAEARRANGLVEFDDLIVLFRPGDRVVADFSETDLLGAEVVSVEEDAGWAFRICTIKLRTISSTKGEPSFRVTSLRIKEFPGLRAIKDLPIRHAGEDQIRSLTLRGEKFRRYVMKPSYARYQGNLVLRSWRGEIAFRADGRVMVDAHTAVKQAPELVREYSYMESNDDDDEQKKGEFEIPDDRLWMCEPFVLGFSFRTKMWGEFRIEGLTDIDFRSDAIDRLVLDDDRKRMVTALVQNSSNAFADIVEEKGGGCIFLLHGEPGLGKTLTAEAVAEVLRRPLYSVSVGELGTNPGELETKLREILDVASSWNAVVLLDEADIFLEARNEKDITRNAMVGIFLRLLEYHQGVLFLTTNRVRNFDKAFHSRISVALKYPGADTAFRAKVWGNLLEAAGIKGLSPDDLARFEINGRQIKNTIRLAQTLARSENRAVTIADIEKTVAIADQFQKDVDVK
jgi:hypothetical protein